MKTLSVFTPSRVSCPDSSSGVHRFLISSPDLGIDAGFSPFTAPCVHRFLISGPDLRIDARFSQFTPSSVHRFLISSPDLGIDAACCGEQAGTGCPPLRNRCYMLLLIPCRHITPSASDTLLRDSVYLKWIYCWRDLGVPRQAPALPNLQALSRYKEQ